VDWSVHRHQSRPDGVRRRLKSVGAKAKANWDMITIIVLIVTLVLLIAV
jgi:hypothetical protein